MCIDTKVLNAFDVPKLVEAFEEIKEHAPLLELSFLKTKEHNYLYDSNHTHYLYDINADKVLNVLGYLEQTLQSDNLEHIVMALEEKLQRSFRTVNYEAIQTQFDTAKEESTSIQGLCKTLKKHFNVEVALKEDSLTLGNITLTLEELGSNKETLTQEITHNAFKAATKENQEQTQQNRTPKPQGRGF